MERALELPALVLLDEVGGGTDPVEGGALGAAVIDHFRRRGALVVATTHDDALKSYAATTEGADGAAFGFNPETYAPTLPVDLRRARDAASRSRSPSGSGCRRRSSPTRARAASGRESLLAAHLARVDQELAAVEQEKRGSPRHATRWRSERQTLLERESRLTEREAVLKKRLDDKLNERLREARAEVDAVVTR